MDEMKASREQLLATLKEQIIPAHVGVIMDGNGRWAQAHGKKRTDGHRAGVERLRSVLRFSSDAGIQALTVYAFSKENWRRPRWEVEALMRLLIEFLEQELPELKKEGVQIRFIGDREGVPPKVLAAMDRAVAETKEENKIVFNVAFNYGGRDEILRAAKKIWRKAKDDERFIDQLTEDDFAAELDTADLPELDVVIRTSGEERLSNFLLWQCAYAEFVFCQEHWPDFDDERYCAALQCYQNRVRRFGGL